MLLRTEKLSPAGIPTSPSHLCVVLLSTRTNPAQSGVFADLKLIKLKSASEAVLGARLTTPVQNPGQISGSRLLPSATFVVFIQALKYGECTVTGT